LGPLCTRVVLYTEVDARYDKLASVVSRKSIVASTVNIVHVATLHTQSVRLSRTMLTTFATIDMPPRKSLAESSIAVILEIPEVSEKTHCRIGQMKFMRKKSSTSAAVLTKTPSCGRHTGRRTQGDR